MSNVIAGVVRGQYPYLEEHIAKKRQFTKDTEGFKDLPIQMNPITDGTEPNYWLSGMIIDENAMCKQVRSDCEAFISQNPARLVRQRFWKPSQSITLRVDRSGSRCTLSHLSFARLCYP